MRLYENGKKTVLREGDHLSVKIYPRDKTIAVTFYRGDNVLCDQEGVRVIETFRYSPSEGVIKTLLLRLYTSSGINLEDVPQKEDQNLLVFCVIKEDA